MFLKFLYLHCTDPSFSLARYDLGVLKLEVLVAETRSYFRAGGNLPRMAFVVLSEKAEI